VLQWLLTCSLLFAGALVAGPDQPPYYVKMKGFKIQSFNRKKIEILATAVFYNTYNNKAKLEEVEIDVFLENKLLGRVSQVGDVKIPKLSAFDIPLVLTLEPPGPAVSNSLWQSGRFLFGQKVTVVYKGYIKLKAIGFIPIKIPMEEKMQISIKDLL
jgi:hypothetical protein